MTGAPALLLVLVVAPSSSAAVLDFAPLHLSATTIQVGDTLTVQGSGCTAGNSGAGYGYSVSVRNGTQFLDMTGDPIDADGNWTASKTFTRDAHFPGGRWEVVAQCFDSPNGTPYPSASFTLTPPADIAITDVADISPASVAPGGSVTVSVTGFHRPYDAGVFLYPKRTFLGTITTPDDPSQRVSLVVKLPSTVGPGDYRIVVDGSPNTAAGPLTITSPTVQAPPPTTAAAPTTTTAAPTTTTEPSTTSSTSSSTSSSSSQVAAVPTTASRSTGGGPSVIAVSALASAFIASSVALTFLLRRRRIGRGAAADDVEVVDG